MYPDASSILSTFEPPILLPSCSPINRDSCWYSIPQQLERVRPVVLAEPRDAPELRERLDRTRGDRRSHVGPFPAELIQHPRDPRLRLSVVAAVEHRRTSAAE